MSKKLQNAWFGLSILNRIAPMDQIWIRESFLQYFESYHQKYISNRNFKKKRRHLIVLKEISVSLDPVYACCGGACQPRWTAQFSSLCTVDVTFSLNA